MAFLFFPLFSFSLSFFIRKRREVKKEKNGTEVVKNNERKQMCSTVKTNLSRKIDREPGKKIDREPGKKA